MSSIKKAAIKIPCKQNNRIPNKIYPKIQNQTYKIHISNTNPMNASHEQCQVNPVIPLGAKKAIQHPSINAAYCKKLECEKKPCESFDSTCDEITKVEAIGHGTHSDSSKVKGVEYLSEKDFNGKSSKQYGKFYPANSRVPLPNNDQAYNETATKEVSNNQEMLNNINMYKQLNE